MINVDKVFVCHYSKLTERKEFILKQLKECEINFEFIELEPTQEDIEKYFQYSQSEWEKKYNCLNYESSSPPRKLKNSEISLAFKHLKIYEKIYEKNHTTCLVLEDDVVLEKNFCENFNLFLNKTPSDWDVIFIGSGCNLKIPFDKLQKTKIAYIKEHPASKCTDSYIINIDSVKKILNNMKNINLPIDFELNYQMFFNNLNVYWWEPSLIKQGSQIGLYKSEIQ